MKKSILFHFAICLSCVPCFADFQQENNHLKPNIFPSDASIHLNIPSDHVVLCLPTQEGSQICSPPRSIGIPIDAMQAFQNCPTVPLQPARHCDGSFGETYTIDKEMLVDSFACIKTLGMEVPSCAKKNCLNSKQCPIPSPECALSEQCSPRWLEQGPIKGSDCISKETLIHNTCVRSNGTLLCWPSKQDENKTLLQKFFDGLTAEFFGCALSPCSKESQTLFSFPPEEGTVTRGCIEKKNGLRCITLDALNDAQSSMLSLFRVTILGALITIIIKKYYDKRRIQEIQNQKKALKNLQENPPLAAAAA